MEIFKLAAKQKYRFKSRYGLLSSEQLWDLSVEELDEMAITLEKEVNESGRKSFIKKKSEKNKKAEFEFSIVLDILNTKIEEEQKALQERERKSNNEKIINIIKEKQEASLKEMSIEDLRAMLQ